ncbi:hypothetical protein [Tenacibaculum finnmarkense]|uniref:hypothetical protein n=1 Tax=Tenacibaculum finnmarkense TaxID=2781243 RepID=UPI001EFBBFF7|nr:hypothetical protein [Tenacibaculum finnmarkense]MCG8734712.1 hypothetical protein [Tenacibaculum finnmarkense]MCG8860019.1 hypothetical protein [Tenacibaculum finnmarkense]
MLLQQFSLVFSGGNTPSNKVLEKISKKHKLAFTLDVDKDNEETSICILHPRKYGFSGNIDNYSQWFVEFIKSEYEMLSLLGLNDIEIVIDLFFSEKHSSTEILNNEFLFLLNKYNISSIAINTHQLEISELKEELLKQNYSKDEFSDLIK